MIKRLLAFSACVVTLAIVVQGCGQPAPEVSTPVPTTAAPSATEPAPTGTPIDTEEPTATAEPTQEQPTATPEPTEEEPTATDEAEPTTGPVGEEGEALLEDRCMVCHTLDRVMRSQKSREEWDTTVERMVNLGARLTDAEKEGLVDYLAATYGD